MRVKTKKSGRVKINCTRAQAQAILCLIGTACCGFAVERVFPRAKFGQCWRAFKRAGFKSDILLDEKCRVGKTPGNMYPSVSLTNAMGIYFGIPAGRVVDKTKPDPLYKKMRMK